MYVAHKNLIPGVETEIILPVKTGAILVKNRTTDVIKVSIGVKDFTNNYVTIDSGASEELCNCMTSSACPSRFFKKVFARSAQPGEIEIRCLKI